MYKRQLLTIEKSGKDSRAHESIIHPVSTTSKLSVSSTRNGNTVQEKLRKLIAGKRLASLPATNAKPAKSPSAPSRLQTAGAATRNLRMSRRSVISSAGGRRRSLGMQPKSDETKISEAMDRIKETPRTGALPPMEFNVNVGRQIANILNIQHNKWGMVDVEVKGRFHSAMRLVEINNLLRGRLNRNIGHFCKTCTNVVPVFYNLVADVGDKDSRRSRTPAATRKLLQAMDPSALVDYTGTVSLMLSYEQLNDNSILYDEVFKSLLDTKYTDVWTGDLQDSANMENYFQNLQNNQFAVRNIRKTWDSYNTTQIVLHTRDGGGAGGTATLGQGSASTTQQTGGGGGSTSQLGGNGITDEFGAPISVQGGAEETSGASPSLHAVGWGRVLFSMLGASVIAMAPVLLG